jgi:SAM-dependent methyltransferase
VRRRIVRPLLHRLRRPIVLRRIARRSEVQFLGHVLSTRPNVFHPTLFSSSQILAEYLVAGSVLGLRVLDMGTGSGAIAIALAAAGAVVTACDRNPDAVALARENARRNHVAVVVLESDLFAALGCESFDLIDFNVPFYETEPTTHFEAAFRAGKDLETISGAPRCGRARRDRVLGRLRPGDHPSCLRGHGVFPGGRAHDAQPPRGLSRGLFPTPGLLVAQEPAPIPGTS